MIMDLNKAVEHVARLLDETPETIRELVIAFADDQDDAMRVGIESGRMAWPFPEDETPKGSVPWQVAAHEYERAGMTELCITPYGVLWLNSQ